MQDTIIRNVVQETDEYDKFNLMTANRSQNRGHVEALKTAFEEIGNLTKVQPILVNENFDIIDGQHRFVACRELGEPIFYTVVPGLGIEEARSMNILHRNWTVQDFAESYANSGNKHYAEYLQLKEEFGFNHSIMLNYLNGSESRGSYAKFRKGDFKLADRKAAIDRLNKLAEVGEYAEELVNDRYFALAVLRAMNVDEYDHKHMVKKLELHGNQLLERRATTFDYLRLLEEIYNYKMSEENRTRLY